MPGGLLDDDDVVLDAVLAQHHGRLGERVAAEVVGQGPLALDDDVAALELGVEPAVLLPRLERQQAAEEGGEEDEEDASARVGSLAGGCPGGREERGGHGSLEDGHHVRGRRRVAA